MWSNPLIQLLQHYIPIWSEEETAMLDDKKMVFSVKCGEHKKALTMLLVSSVCYKFTKMGYQFILQCVIQYVVYQCKLMNIDLRYHCTKGLDYVDVPCNE